MKNILRKLIYKIKNAKLSTKITLIILLVLEGGLTVNHIEQKQEMIKIAKEHKEEMNQEVRYRDENHHIKSITYEWNTVKKSPMGGFMLNGYVNDNKNLDFGIAFDKYSGKIECRLYKSCPEIGKWKGF